MPCKLIFFQHFPINAKSFQSQTFNLKSLDSYNLFMTTIRSCFM